MALEQAGVPHRAAQHQLCDFVPRTRREHQQVWGLHHQGILLHRCTNRIGRVGIPLFRRSNSISDCFCFAWAVGGGRKIIRVEVSFDQGTTCELGTINQVEEATEYGRHWCWVFWELSTTAERMAGAPEIWCRGWDEAQNTQPEASTWNAAGVMNNGVFKLRVAADGSSVSFQQPTQPGPLGGGYMVNKSAELKAKPLGPITLNKKKVKLPLEKKTVISPDTVILRLSLPSKDHLLGLPCGQHMFIYLKGPDGKLVIRAYTPITGDNVRGYVDLLIKVYRCCEQFPKGGEMSQLLDSLAIGDQVEVKGPIGHFHYLGRGRYTKDDVPGTCRRLSMVAGGTGITPMWQVLQEVLADPEDKTEIRLLFANRHTEDILLKEELDALAAKHDNFAVRYTLSGRCPEGWDQCTGRITKEMLESHIFPTGDDETLCLLCGPQGMIDVAAKPNLEKMGYKESSFVIF